MHKLGTIYGADLLLDTDNAKVIELANKEMEEMVQARKTMTSLPDELKNLINKYELLKK